MMSGSCPATRRNLKDFRVREPCSIWPYCRRTILRVLHIRRSKGRPRSWFQLLDRSCSNDVWVVPSHQKKFKRFSRVRTLFNLALLSQDHSKGLTHPTVKRKVKELVPTFGPVMFK